MDAYTGFAAVYDEFMENIPYDEVGDYLLELLKEENTEEGILLELGCGTGEMTMRMSRAGFDMIGLDASDEMLNTAREKLLAADDIDNDAILYSLQDMREFELYGTVRAAFAVTDTMNYITEADDFIRVLTLVNNYLDPGGVFIFDLKTEHFFRDVLEDRTFADHREDATLIWENTYDEEIRMHEYAVTIFRKREDNSYRKEEEFHYQRAYSLSQVKQMAEAAGMVWVNAYRAYTKEPANENRDERFYIILREQGKSRK